MRSKFVESCPSRGLSVSRHIERWIASSAAALLLIAGCGGDSVVAGKTCEESDCQHFVFLCSDDTVMSGGGCSDSDECLSQDEAVVDPCPDSDVRAVTSIAAGEPIPDLKGDAGSSNADKSMSGEDRMSQGSGPGSFKHRCEDNAQYFIGFDDSATKGIDCTLSATVCEENEADNSTSCRPPVAGDQCYAEGTFGCTEDGRSALVCKSASFEDAKFKCPGNSACVTPGHNYAACQDDTGDITIFTLAGGPCAKDGTYSCGADGTKVNGCEAGTWVTSKHCGSVGCKLQKDVTATDFSTETDNYYACSNGSATLGDLCTKEGGAYCTTDLAAILECSSGTLQPFRTCAAGEQCGMVLKDGKQVLGCRSSSYVVGDICHFPEGMLVCTADGTQILACEGGMMSLQETCKAGAQCQPGIDELGLPTVECM